jgi:putative ABC transport system permease protein
VALGAARRDVLRLVVGRALLLTAAGLAIGLPAAFALSKLAASVLYGAVAPDAGVFAALTLLLGAVAALAAYLPARQAASVDPIVALRYE